VPARLTIALALLAVLGLGPAPAVAEWDDEDEAAEWGGPDDEAPEEAEYHQALAPYGQWMADASYGTVWRPTVAVGWRPYVDGSWVWTSYGWTWVSSGPWAWTFHYGRWALLPAYGWVWVPGTVWGPAWVDWYVSDGYVGWAPLPPFGARVAVVNQFVFVRSHDFCRPYVRRAFVDHDHLPGHVVRHWRDRRAFRPPARDHIERVSRTPVVRVHGRPHETLRPRDLDRRLRPSGPHAGEARSVGGGRRHDGEAARRPRSARPARDSRPRAAVDPARGRSRWAVPDARQPRPDRVRPTQGGGRDGSRTPIARPERPGPEGARSVRPGAASPGTGHDARPARGGGGTAARGGGGASGHRGGSARQADAGHAGGHR
jgi:hypothetical protein